MGFGKGIIEGTMIRVSQDYLATREASCEICHRTIFQGMYCFRVKLRTGREGIAHSLCEQDLKKTELEGEG